MESLVYNFFAYSTVNAFTPGPGNILALNTVTSYGWAKGSPLIWGIFAGYYSVQIICAIFVYGLCSALPEILIYMKYIGATYIAWLAIHIFCSPAPDNNGDKKSSFFQGFFLQFVNIKIYLFGITALTSFVARYSTDLWILLAAEIVIATIGSFATLTWVGAGIAIQRYYIRHYKVINLTLSLTLIHCIYSILCS